ncbi:MAG: winged helix-turn-helix transcriptional regulator [Elusimicrobia bacterium]|nr:winged helix-turn-helix transcriptional regulator [Elusimicrobiota bacterium]
MFSNPGGFPEGVTISNILVTPPQPRNPLLADALKRAGLVERTARGVDTIFFEQLRNGRPAPTYEQSTPTSVVLILPGGEANLGFIKFAIEEQRNGKELDLDQLMILNLLWVERRIDTARVAGVLQKPESEARSKLQNLVEAGYIEARGVSRGRFFHLSANIYKRFGGEAAYQRQKGQEPQQQEVEILDFITKNGRITRLQTAELCKLSPIQARYILKKMVNDKKLAQKGKQKGTYYEKSA